MFRAPIDQALQGTLSFFNRASKGVVAAFAPERLNDHHETDGITLKCSMYLVIEVVKSIIVVALGKAIES